jgi:hypothetical protein
MVKTKSTNHNQNIVKININTVGDSKKKRRRKKKGDGNRGGMVGPQMNEAMTYNLQMGQAGAARNDAINQEQWNSLKRIESQNNSMNSISNNNLARIQAGQAALDRQAMNNLNYSTTSSQRMDNRQRYSPTESEGIANYNRNLSMNDLSSFDDENTISGSSINEIAKPLTTDKDMFRIPDIVQPPSEAGGSEQGIKANIPAPGHMTEVRQEKLLKGKKLASVKEEEIQEEEIEDMSKPIGKGPTSTSTTVSPAKPAVKRSDKTPPKSQHELKSEAYKNIFGDAASPKMLKTTSIMLDQILLQNGNYPTTKTAFDESSKVITDKWNYNKGIDAMKIADVKKELTSREIPFNKKMLSPQLKKMLKK